MNVGASSGTVETKVSKGFFFQLPRSKHSRQVSILENTFGQSTVLYVVRRLFDRHLTTFI